MPPVNVYMTSRIGHYMQDKEFKKQVNSAVKRFFRRDYGNVPEEDVMANLEDLRNRDGHVLGRYETKEGDIYINLEFVEPIDIAMIMFCEEY